ncbi:MAG TPA: alpha/beta hydrolase-fold protein [Daejeonella sp.]|uniref:alpha/beta hydrolase n=1 Tax=Daejeonella sp. TaxID=2805397 RepID=UPI002ED88EA5
MNKLIIIVTFCLTCISTHILQAQDVKAKNIAIETGQIITIKSTILGEERNLYISLPPGYDTINTKLPVIYVLDAEYRFGIAQSIQTYFNITTKIPPAILVGIANPTKEARSRDYLPQSYGGQAEKFSKFLSTELFQYIQKNYKANETRYLVGHSHGGVFAVYTLLNEPNLFEGYIAIDPSLKHIFKEGSNLLNRDLNGKRLYLASSDVAYGYLEDVASDMQADFAIFKNHLYQTRGMNKLAFKIDHINDDHGNSYIQGFSRGLRYLMNWRFE